MKKIAVVLSFIVLFSLAALVHGQSRDNVITINYENYRVIDAEMEYYGNYYSEDAVNIDFFIELSDDCGLYFELFVPNGNRGLAAGTYTRSGNRTQFTYSRNSSFETDYDDFDITGGTLEVSTSGGGAYTIIIDCTYSDGDTTGTIKGTYRGTPDWSDES